MKELFEVWKGVPMVVIGMLHLPALPGAPGFMGNLRQIRQSVLKDAEVLTAGGVHGLMIENFGDIPFFPGRVPVEVVAHMTALASEVKHRFDLPLGINVLRNDGLSALSVASAIGAEFIRVNVLSGARVTDQGLLQGIAHDLLRLRASLHATDIKIFADVDVKHSAPLAPRPIVDEVDDTIHRGLADALIVSGAGTGKKTDPRKLTEVVSAAGEVPVFVGSGVTAKTVQQYRKAARGVIVGTALKTKGIPANPVDPEAVRQFMNAVKRI